MKRMALGLAFVVAMVGCEEPGETGEDIGQTAGEIGQETEQAAERTGEAMERAGEDVAQAGEQFLTFDENQSGAMEREEFDSWWDDHGQNLWDQWDTNQDGQLDQQEFQQSLGQVQGTQFGQFDADGDGNVTEEEVRQGLFQLFDQNQDQRITQSEWEGQQMQALMRQGQQGQGGTTG